MYDQEDQILPNLRRDIETINNNKANWKTVVTTNNMLVSREG